MSWDTTDALKYVLDAIPAQEPLKWKHMYKGSWFSAPYKSNATSSGIMAAQEYANQIMAQAMQDLYYQYQYQILATYVLAPPVTMPITGITDPYYLPLKLPAKPKVDRVESIFHLLDEKHRLMCTGKHSTYIKAEVLSDRDSHTAVTRFQKFFCPDCQPHLTAYATAA